MGNLLPNTYSLRWKKWCCPFSIFGCPSIWLYSQKCQGLDRWFPFFCKDEDEHLQCLRNFFEICRHNNLKLSAKKSTLFTTNVKWCGRIIDSQGITFDPTRISGLANVSTPQTAGEVSEFFHFLQWLSTAIPDFARRVQPLRQILEAAYKKSGSRKLRSINKLSLSNL